MRTEPAEPAFEVLAAAALLCGGAPEAMDRLPGPLAAGARAEIARLGALDRVRRATSLGRSVPAALRPAPGPDAQGLADVARGVPSIAPALRALGLPVEAGAPVRGARGPAPGTLVALGAAVGPGKGASPSWLPAVRDLGAAGIRLLARAGRGGDPRLVAELCRLLEPADAEALVAADRRPPGGDPEVARRILAALAKDAGPEPGSLAVRAGAYRVGWALGGFRDAPAGWPAPLVEAVRRAQSAAALCAPESDGESERAALDSESR
jgi:hypothetical protein